MVDILHNLSHLPPSLWNLSAMAISAILVVTSTISREATKHSNCTRQIIRKRIESTWKTNSVNIILLYCDATPSVSHTGQAENFAWPQRDSNQQPLEY